MLTAIRPYLNKILTCSCWGRCVPCHSVPLALLWAPLRCSPVKSDCQDALDRHSCSITAGPRSTGTSACFAWPAFGCFKLHLSSHFNFTESNFICFVACFKSSEFNLWKHVLYATITLLEEVLPICVSSRSDLQAWRWNRTSIGRVCVALHFKMPSSNCTWFCSNLYLSQVREASWSYFWGK